MVTRQRSSRSYFSLNDENFCLVNGDPLENWLISDAQSVHKSHLVNTNSDCECMEAILFAIASQTQTFEVATAFIRGVREQLNSGKLEEKDLYKEAVLDTLAENSLFRQNRFFPIMEFIQRKYGKPSSFAEDFFESPERVRDEVVENKDIKFMAAKTTSFVGLCFGVTSQMTLDIHNYRALHGLGIKMKEDLYMGSKRIILPVKAEVKEDDLFGFEIKEPNPFEYASSKAHRKVQVRKVASQPSSYREYKRIEDDAKQVLEPILRNYEAFREGNSINWALATSLFWWVGAKMSRNGLQAQLPLEGDLTSFLYRR